MPMLPEIENVFSGFTYISHIGSRINGKIAGIHKTSILANARLKKRIIEIEISRRHRNTRKSVHVIC